MPAAGKVALDRVLRGLPRLR